MLAAKIVIRKAEMGDALGILSCLSEAFAPYRTDYTPEAFQDTVLTADTLARRMATMTIVVAVSDKGEIIGTIGCGVASPGEGHLRGMAVRDRCQGLGVAEKLLQCAEAELLARKCSRITLDTTLPLQRAVRFYEKHGYRRSGRTQDFYGMPLVEYVKEIGPSPTSP